MITRASSYIDPQHYVQCEQCDGATVRHASDGEAIAAWNRRASPAPAIPAVDRDSIIEQCAQVCEMERAAFQANEAVWDANPALRPDDEYIADWESSACRGEEYAARIRALKAAPAISESEDARDAARYRWLQRQRAHVWHEIADMPINRTNERIDAAIDVARAGGKS
ncbi:hypothetical protein [Burkholderia gladioli]|uniref:hypothetical protein n=1 Tax=Burkholderia gladioli TaxID=28095 RepID=UPI001FC8B793|nr:hypothetical protein [Burkholderia gladioli]